MFLFFVARKKKKNYLLKIRSFAILFIFDFVIIALLSFIFFRRKFVRLKMEKKKKSSVYNKN
jgi:hypothetical protein